MGKRYRQQTSYLGSVRFFKHMILAVLALLILIPTVLFLVTSGQNRALRAQLRAAQESPLQDVAEEDPSPAADVPPTEEDGAEDGPAYRLLYPDLHRPAAGRTPVYAYKTAYLTFDDGPSGHTDEILDILDQYNVKATFFVVGRTDEESIRRMKRIVQEGHTLGLHSYSHDYYTIYASVEDYLEDIHALYALVKENVGVEPTLIRFPGGSINGYNAVIWQDLVVEMVRRGFVYFDWNVSSSDASNSDDISANKIVSNCLNGVDRLNRAVILMHDSSTKRTTVEALPRVIEGYRAADFSFAALDENVKPVIFNYEN